MSFEHNAMFSNNFAEAEEKEMELFFFVWGEDISRVYRILLFEWNRLSDRILIESCASKDDINVLQESRIVQFLRIWLHNIHLLEFLNLLFIQINPIYR